jgi:hypothetical protein
MVTARHASRLASRGRRTTDVGLRRGRGFGSPGLTVGLLLDQRMQAPPGTQPPPRRDVRHARVVHRGPAGGAPSRAGRCGPRPLGILARCRHVLQRRLGRARVGPGPCRITEQPHRTQQEGPLMGALLGELSFANMLLEFREQPFGGSFAGLVGARVHGDGSRWASGTQLTFPRAARDFPPIPKSPDQA